MAYELNHLTKLSALQALAQRAEAAYAKQADLEALEGRVDDIVSTGGEPNAIDTIKVNGVAQEVTDKAVDITVPTKVSDLTNDSEFQTNAQVTAAIHAAIAATGHAHFEKVDAVPEAEMAEENVLYLVMNSQTKHYDIYAKVEDEVVLLDDTTVDLSGYVQKEEGKGLSTNDYTTEEKNRLAGLNNYTHPAYTPQDSGLYKFTVDATGHVSAVTAVVKDDITGLGIPGRDTTYSEATASQAGLMSAADKTKLNGMVLATDEEVTEMLDEIYGPVSE